MHIRDTSIAVAAALMLGSCARETPLFELMPPDYTGIAFANTLTPAETLNTYVFRNFYNGGGVAIGDLTHDGLADIFVTGNQVSNRLYVNLGNWRFEDRTQSAGLESTGAWTTGVSLLDINADGWLDIYLCKSGPPSGPQRSNALYINRKDGTFIDRAEAYGLAFEALSIHASFFDYDGDKDLDLYLLSNPLRSLDDLQPAPSLRMIPDSDGGNRLLRNNGPDRLFTDVTEASRIYSSRIGFGLGVSASDITGDGWTDFYVSNDFFERDYLYVNLRNGAFREIGHTALPGHSLSSMGGDIADLNHDGNPDIFISDMLPQSPARYQSRIAFADWAANLQSLADGYHHQTTRNTLQVNLGADPGDSAGARFSDISRLTGTDATDWSWGALIADFDLDGYRDIFVPNGIYKDLLDQDFIRLASNQDSLRAIFSREDEPILALLENVPSEPLRNYMFAGGPSWSLTNMASAWGLDLPGYSNGAAYGDLDNDGDLDLVVNNVNMPAFVYRNHAAQSGRNWLQIVLRGHAPNTQAIGAQVAVWSSGRLWFTEQQPVRGYLSSVDPTLHFSFPGDPDSVIVQWPHGPLMRYTDFKGRSRVILHEP
ncbi:MAG: CRTAC1 family protein [Bacteroidota bacterium]|nr:CRTAC1 family protein [Bacteroidota bacterium]